MKKIIVFLDTALFGVMFDQFPQPDSYCWLDEKVMYAEPIVMDAEPLARQPFAAIETNDSIAEEKALFVSVHNGTVYSEEQYLAWRDNNIIP
jgi:hypothetical protein